MECVQLQGQLCSCGASPFSRQLGGCGDVAGWRQGLNHHRLFISIGFYFRPHYLLRGVFWGFPFSISSSAAGYYLLRHFRTLLFILEAKHLQYMFFFRGFGIKNALASSSGIGGFVPRKINSSPLSSNHILCSSQASSTP